MITQKKILVYLFILFLIAFVPYLLASGNHCPEQIIKNESIVDAPDFISYLWPAPGSKISIICYHKSFKTTLPFRGISVILHPESIIDLEVFEGSTEIEKPFTDRVYLYIDGVQISNSSPTRLVSDNLVGLTKVKNGMKLQQRSDLSSAYTISWNPYLLPGHHVARMVIETKSGRVLEYQWDFTIW